MEFLNCLSTVILTVHPVPAPFSTRAEAINSVNDGGNNQKLILFSLGNQFYISNFLPIWTMSSSCILIYRSLAYWYRYS